MIQHDLEKIDSVRSSDTVQTLWFPSSQQKIGGKSPKNCQNCQNFQNCQKLKKIPNNSKYNKNLQRLSIN